MRYFSLRANLYCELIFTLALSFLACLFSPAVLAGCAFTPQAGGGNGTNTGGPVNFLRVTNALLNGTLWIENDKYPIGTLMGVPTTDSLKTNVCRDYTAVKDHFIAAVYEPPANAQPYANGYRIPAPNNPGITAEVLFSNGGSPLPPGPGGGLLIWSSSSKVTTSGVLLGVNSLPRLDVRITLIKSGPLEHDVRVYWPNIGTIRYYSTDTTPAIQDPTFNELTITPDNNNLVESAVSNRPACKIDTGVQNSLKGETILLSPVSQNDFKGVGAIDKSVAARTFHFSCTSFDGDTKPTVTFDSDYMHNGGVDGVGLPAASNDVGIQVLSDGVPVKLGVPLFMDLVFQPAPPNITPGRYCLASSDCDDVNNWKGQPGYKQEQTPGREPKITFKYYQTTGTKPKAQKITVPFTVTLDYQ